MRCKPGDIAILIEDHPRFQEQGLLLDVLRLSDEELDMWICSRKDGRRLWSWETVFGVEIPWLTKECGIPDSWLYPIRGLPLTKDSSTTEPSREDIAELEAIRRGEVAHG